ncbi:MAG: 5-deoxy-glucuronate isomerase [Acidobacteria bacterium]|nr:5-deoxy-glucuronate isomerase [Acidobacteriota bacterium]MBS1865769.1 5-deoxy-glucuronate isomerase [Acidobacteriota bacterium]
MTTSGNLLIRGAQTTNGHGIKMDVEPKSIGFDYLSLRVKSFEAGEEYKGYTGESELGIVILGGCIDVSSTNGAWTHIGGRVNVFGGMPWAVYLPIGTSYTVTARSECDLAFCSSRAEIPYPAALIEPSDVRVEVRGGANATRQINHIIAPEFPAQRLLIVEVYTPGGNWSSYPPHKHDVHNPPGEVDLEELYYYRIDKPEGYAIQRVYTRDRRLDSTMTVRDGDLVLIPEGYHPVVAAHGYNIYYLNVLAGSAHSMAASDDPDHSWVRHTWNVTDPRVPIVK